MDQGKLGSQEIMYKYVSTLERLAPRFGTEGFLVYHLDMRPDGDGSGSYLNASRRHEPTEDITCGQLTHEVMVSGNAGIQWRKISTQRVSLNLAADRHLNKGSFGFRSNIGLCLRPVRITTWAMNTWITEDKKMSLYPRRRLTLQKTGIPSAISPISHTLPSWEQMSASAGKTTSQW